MPEFCTQEKNIGGLPDEALLEVRIQIHDIYGNGDKWFVTPFMITPEEVDHHINRIIEKLEVVGEQAKARLSENCQEPSDSN